MSRTCRLSGRMVDSSGDGWIGLAPSGAGRLRRWLPSVIVLGSAGRTLVVPPAGPELGSSSGPSAASVPAPRAIASTDIAIIPLPFGVDILHTPFNPL